MNEDLKKKTAKAIVAASTASTLVSGPVITEDDNFIHPEPVTEEYDQIKTQQQLRQRNSFVDRLPTWAKSLIGVPLQLTGSAIANAISNLLSNPTVRRLLLSALLILILIGAVIFAAKLLFPNLSVKKLLNNRWLILGICLMVILFILMDIMMDRYWDDYDLYSSGIKISFATITLVTATYQIYLNNRQTYLHAETDKYSFEEQ